MIPFVLGVFRPNAAVWVPMFLMLYSMLWIGLITIYIEGDTTKPHATYSALIFFPLSFAGESLTEPVAT